MSHYVVGIGSPNAAPPRGTVVSLNTDYEDVFHYEFSVVDYNLWLTRTDVSDIFSVWGVVVLKTAHHQPMGSWHKIFKSA